MSPRAILTLEEPGADSKTLLTSRLKRVRDGRSTTSELSPCDLVVAENPLPPLDTTMGCCELQIGDPSVIGERSVIPPHMAHK